MLPPRKTEADANEVEESKSEADKKPKKKITFGMLPPREEEKNDSD